MNRMEALKRWGGSNIMIIMDGREELKRKVRCIGNGREELKGKGRSNERDEKELKRKEGSNEWKGRVATKGRTQ